MQSRKRRILNPLTLTALLTMLVCASYAQETPYLQWAYRFSTGTSLDDYGRKIKVDASGNVYTLGIFSGSADFDPGPAVFTLQSTKQGTNYTNDIFITKFNSSGGFIWAKAIGGVSTDIGAGLALDNFGNVLLTGRFDETVDFDPGAGTFNLTTTSGGMFVLKLKSNGDFVWATAVEFANGLSITTDNSGNVYTSGSFTGTADFDPGVSTFTRTSTGNTDIFIQKLDASGNFMSAITIGGSGADSSSEIIFSPLNEIYLTGYFSATVDFDPGAGTASRTSSGGFDTFLSKWSTSLNLTWANRFGAAGTDIANGAAVDAAGSVYFTGYFQNTVDFDPSGTTVNLISAGGWDIFIGRYSPAGDLSMAKRIGSASDEYGNRIAVDASNNIYVTGAFRSTVDFDPGAGAFNLTSNGNYDIFNMKLNSSGNFVWATSAGAANSDVGYDIATDGLGNIYSTGGFRNTVDFDFGTAELKLTSYSYLGLSQSDPFIQKIITTPSLFVYTQPTTSTSICSGSTTTFSVLGTGTSNVTYQWEKFNGTVFGPLGNDAVISGATTSKLTFTNSTVANNGIYRCKISGDLVSSVFTNSGTLTIIAPPTAPTTTGASICGGGKVMLTAAGGTEGNYRWYTDLTGGPIIDPDLGTEGEPIGTSTLQVDVTATTTFYATIINGQCESTRTPVTATVTSYTATPAELAALSALYTATDGDHWNDNSNWDGSDVSMYYGVSTANCKISGIELSGNNLVGSIPSEIGDLASLISLNLADNQLSGSLPQEIGNLTQLEALDLSLNNLTGSLPIELANLTSLTELKFNTNLLSGPIPPELGNLTTLVTLDLGQNKLSGTIPTGLGSLSSLSYIDLSYNLLTGGVPASFVALPQLGSLLLSGNSLNDLPDLSSSITLSQLYVDNNQLTFGDLEPNVTLPDFYYDPQDLLPPGGVISFVNGGTFSIPFSTTGNDNQYQWNKDGTDLAGATSPTLTVSNADDSSVGIYNVRVTNTVATGTTMYSKNYFVQNSFCSTTTPTGGDLDFTFAPVFDGGDPYSAIELQSTGKSIVTTPAGLLRFNTDGTVDGSFTNSNYYPTHHQLAVQSDNKIVTVADEGSESKLLRLKEDGTLDATLLTVDNSGYYTSYFGPLAVQQDGKILYSIGNTFYYNPDLMRRNSDGTDDTSFANPSGLYATVIKPQPSGEIYVGSYQSPYIYRLDNIGNVDGSFDPGSSLDGSISDLLVQADGKILIVGSFTSYSGVGRNGIARLNADGTLDTSFDPGIGFSGGQAETISLGINGEIIVGGNFIGYNGTYRPGIASIKSNGSLDCSFDPGSGADGSITDFAVQANGKILIAGNFTSYNGTTRYWLARINNAPPSVITIDSQPGDKNVCVGSIITFSTAASGTSNITYKWQLRGTDFTFSDVVDGGAYSGAATPTLTVNTGVGVVSTAYRCLVSGDFVTSVLTNTATFTPIVTPPAPTTVGATLCLPSSVTLTATGASNGQYRWYTVATGGTAIAGEVNGSYNTPVLSTSQTYYVGINFGSCDGPRTPVIANIQSVNPPTTTAVSMCGPATITLSASGATNGQYRWYSVATGGSAFAGEVNDTFTTPSLTTTTSYYVAINNGTCESTRTIVTATVSTISPPAIISSSRCGTGTVTLNATGGSSGQYRWYDVPSGGTALTGQTNSTLITPSLASTTSYYVAINNGTCESTRTLVTATIEAIPSAPTTTSASRCGPGTVTLNAAGGSAGQYRWYDVPTGGTALTGQINSTFTTPSLSATTSYYVAINNGSCESPRTSVIATITVCNQPPVISVVPVTTQIEGKISVSLTSTLSDPDNNLDLSTLRIVKLPASGASASIDAAHNLLLDYKGISFSGTDRLTIEVCDLLGSCAQKEFTIDVVGEVVVYNGVSPNGDQQNDFLLLKNIEVLESTKSNHVFIYNRWGDLIFDIADYDNKEKIFRGLNNQGNEIPSGTYFYKIEFVGDARALTGYITLKRQ